MIEDIGDKIDRLRQDVREDVQQIRQDVQISTSETRLMVRELERMVQASQQMQTDRLSVMDQRLSAFRPEDFVRRADFIELKVAAAPVIRGFWWTIGLLATGVGVPLIALVLVKGSH